MRGLIRRLFCSWYGHDWTALVQQSKQVPRDMQPKSGDSTEVLMAKFKAYSTMYCRRCGYEYQP